MYEDILDSILDALDLLRTKKRIYIFGTKRIGKMSLSVLKQFQWEGEVCFVDNNSSMWGKRVAELLVLDPKVLKQTEPTDFILVASSHYPAISNQLASYGLKKDIHYMVVLLPNRTAEPRTTQDQVITGVKVGKYSYGYQHLIDDNGLLAEVGAFCSINPGAKIVPNHPTEFITTHTFLYVNKDVCIPPENVPGIMNPGETLKLHEISKNGKVHIGHDVWIGTDVVIMPGVTIGNGAIIGANAVVTKDIPDYAVAVGVPAKVQRYRFSEEQIRILNEVQWWNWPDEQIKENFKLFGDNEAFFAKFAPVNA